jgi:hypothetical protein
MASSAAVHVWGVEGNHPSSCSSSSARLQADPRTRAGAQMNKNGVLWRCLLPIAGRMDGRRDPAGGRQGKGFSSINGNGAQRRAGVSVTESGDILPF